MRRFTVIGLVLLAVGVLLAPWGGATPDRSAANEGTGTMQFRVPSGAVACTPLPYPTECTVATGGTFELAADVVDFPAGGYSAAGTDYDWTGSGLIYKPRSNAVEVPWPDRGNVIIDSTVMSPTRIRHADLSEGFGSTPSQFKGTVVALRFNCTAEGSTNVVTLVPGSTEDPYGAALFDGAGDIFPVSDSITINCVSPTLDTDGDGCTDLRELGSNPMQGGVRNPNYFWDFYDVPDFSNVRDRVVTTTGDILRVARRFGANDMMGTAPVNRNSDPLAGPIPPFPEYHPAFDRGPAPMGSDAWDMTPPDGFITVMADVLGVVRQIGHNCLN